MTLVAPALLVHVYVPTGGPRAEPALADLRRVWAAVGERLGLTDPVPGLGVPVELPEAGSTFPHGRALVAARQRTGESVWQACLRVEHDVLWLTLMMAPARDAGWGGLEDRWAAIAADAAGLLGEVRIFLALTGPGTPDAVRGSAPRSERVGWWSRRDLVPLPAGTGHLDVWEIGPADDGRATRRLLATAPVEHEARVDHLVWTVGDGEPTPLGRHLLHAAKIRYQFRVFDHGRVSGRYRQGGIDSAEQLGEAVEVAERLRRMRRGVAITGENLRGALTGVTGTGPLSDDRALALWFSRRLDDEITELEAACRHARRHTVGEPAVRSAATTPAGQVFVTYTDDSPEHRADVLRLCALLVEQGVDTQLDRWHGDVRRDWYSWALERVLSAEFVVVIASPLYREIGDGTAHPPHHTRAQAEAALLRELLHGDRPTWLPRLVPVLLPGRTPDDIPLFLQPHTADHYPVTDFTAEGVEDLLRLLTRQPGHRRPPLGRPPHLPSRDPE